MTLSQDEVGAASVALEGQPAPFVKDPRPRRVLVIGGGVAGLAALRMLVEENGVVSPSSSSSSSAAATVPNGNGQRAAAFDRVELIERRADIGGTWYLDDETLNVERSYPGGTADHQWPVYARASGHADGNGSAVGEAHATRPFWPSPAYPALRGNVLPRFLSLSGQEPFPTPAGARQAVETNGAGTARDGQTSNGIADRDAEQRFSSAPAHSYDPFPTLDETEAYLRRVAAPLRPHIRTNTECLGVWELPCESDLPDKNRWAVRIRDWNDGGREQTEYWDAIVSASGWTDKPLYPRTPGLEEARQRGLVDHCKWYRGPEPYGPEKRIIIIGNGNSGNDAAAQIAALRTVGKHEPVFRAIRHRAPHVFPSLADARIRDVPVLEKIVLKADPDKEGGIAADVTLADGSIIPAVDKIIVAAGYELLSVTHVDLLNSMPAKGSLIRELLPQGQDPDWSPDERNLSHDQARTLRSLWRGVADPPGGVPYDSPGIDGANPARVPDLWLLTLHARAATLAFVNLAQNSIPFTCSDVQAHLIRAIWDGSGSASGILPKTMKERLRWERDRIDEVRDVNAERANSVGADTRAAPSDTDGANGDLLAPTETAQGPFSQAHGPLLSSLRPFHPPERTRVSEFHSLGTNVRPFLSLLRALAVAAKPHWHARLPDFARDDAYFAEHDAMYGQKYASLVARRAALQATQRR